MSIRKPFLTAVRPLPALVAIAIATPVLIVGAGAKPAAAQVTLSHITENRLTGSFDFAGSDYWDTAPSGNPYDIFIISGTDPTGTILNGVTREPSLVLAPGTYDFTMLTQPGGLDTSTNVALNLFFDGSNAMQISGYNTFGSGTTTPIATPAGHTSLSTYSNATTPGSLLYTASNGTTVALTQLVFGNAGFDRIDSYSATPGDGNDYVTHMRLVVSASAPEPGTLGLLALSAPAFLALRRRK